jgi:hypothetical protein
MTLKIILRPYLSLLCHRLTCHRYPHRASSFKISTAVVTPNPEGLEIPSLNTTFPYRWLRDACTCPSCIHPTTQQKFHRTSDIPASILPESIEMTDDGVHISWASADRHHSFFPQAFLSAHASPNALHSFHNDVPVTLWPTASALLAASGGDLEVPYNDLANPRRVLRAITQLQRTGLLFLRGVPCDDTSDSGCEVRKLAARFAEIRGTFYGEVWNVKNVTKSRNIAYTNLFLGLHMDLQCVHGSIPLSFSIYLPPALNGILLPTQVLRMPATLPDTALLAQPRVRRHLPLRRCVRRGRGTTCHPPHGLCTAR